MTQEEKNKAQYLLAERLDLCEAQLKAIEPRL